MTGHTYRQTTFLGTEGSFTAKQVLNRGSSGEMEPPTPLHGTRTWGAEFASAEENARKLSPNKNVFFNTWRARRDAGEEGPASPTASQVTCWDEKIEK